MRPLSSSLRESLDLAVETFHKSLAGGPGAAYLAARGITPECSARFKLGYVDTDGVPGFERFVGRLAIPNPCATEGRIVSLKFRAIGDQEPKYDAPVGWPTRLFNLDALNSADDTIVITEGELDAITLSMYGISAIGVPGAHNWKKHHASILEGFRKVVLLRDADDAGGEMARKILATDLPVIVVQPPHGTKDANEAHVAGLGDELVRVIRGALK